MADMNKRHHKLISDAVVEGIEAIADNPAIQRQLGEGGDVLVIQRWIATTIADTMAKKLAYTHDNFDPRDFKRDVTQPFNQKR
jgi:hypothetical protein